MAALRKHAATTGPEEISEPIDFFVFERPRATVSDPEGLTPTPRT